MRGLLYERAPHGVPYERSQKGTTSIKCGTNRFPRPGQPRFFASARTAEIEVCQHMMLGALDASSLADDSTQAGEVSTLPAQDVLPKALSVTFSLMKPAGNGHPVCLCALAFG